LAGIPRGEFNTEFNTQAQLTLGVPLPTTS
jgi:hypothetical protein